MWGGGPERAPGAALAKRSERRGGRTSDAGGGCPRIGAEAVKSPRLALERLQRTNSATLVARMGTGKEWEARGLESAGREGGGVATVSTAGRVLCWVGGGVGLETLNRFHLAAFVGT